MSSQFNRYLVLIKYQDPYYFCGKATWFSAQTLAFHQGSLPVICEFGLQIQYLPCWVFFEHFGFLLHAKNQTSSHKFCLIILVHFVRVCCVYRQPIIFCNTAASYSSALSSRLSGYVMCYNTH